MGLDQAVLVAMRRAQGLGQGFTVGTLSAGLV
jgi:hypothetical protein